MTLRWGCEGKDQTGKGSRCNKGYPPAERGIKQSQRNAGQQGQVRVFCLQGRTEQDHRAQGERGGGRGGGGEPLRGWYTRRRHRQQLTEHEPKFVTQKIQYKKERTFQTITAVQHITVTFMPRPYSQFSGQCC